MSLIKTGAVGATPGAFDSMKNIFPVSKTLSFRLIPIGETERNIREKGYLDADKTLAEDCKAMKAAADRIHKDFIEKTLSSFRLKYLSDGAGDSLQDYVEAISSDAEDRDTLVAGVAAALKASIAEAFESVPYTNPKAGTMLKALESELLLKEVIPSIELSDEERLSLGRLQKYTTMMRPYFTIRARMYDAEQDGHTIPNRIVDDNLPIHLSNIRLFDALPAEVVDKAAAIFRFAGGKFSAESVDEVFCVSAFSEMCAQSAIDAYDALIGGVSFEDGSRIQGINELVNLYNQAHPYGRVQKLLMLKKQILSDRDSLSWLPDAIGSDAEVLALLDNLQATFEETIPFGDQVSEAAVRADPARVWVDAGKLESFSHSAFGDWRLAEDCLRKVLLETTPRNARMSEKGFLDKIDRLFRGRKSFSCQEIADAVTAYGGRDASGILGRYALSEILSVAAQARELHDLFLQYVESMDEGEKLGQYSPDNKDNALSRIKVWLDSLVEAGRAASVFANPTGDEIPDPDFHELIVGPWKEFRFILTPAYNRVRNYLTKRPYSTEQLRLMFGNPILLGGWDTDKEPENRGVLFRKGGEVYLGILPSHAKKLFADDAGSEPGSALEKMEVKYLPNPHMMLPKVGIPKKEPKRYGAPDEVIDLYNGPKAVKDYSPEEVAMMIDFYKSVIERNPAWQVFDFQLKETSEYARLSDFYDDVARQNYKMYFRGVSQEYVDRAVEAGDLFLFRLNIQDMQDGHYGKDNNFKVILLEAISDRNVAESYIRLSGNAAVYFREASLKKKVTHPAGVPMLNKNPDNQRRKRTLDYDLSKDLRYMEDRFFLHIPVVIAPDANKRGQARVNGLVRDVIRKNPGMYVLGINRGERSLVSIAVTAPDGKIVEQRNLNVFDNFDYRRKLSERERERTEDRQNWSAVRDIKNLKAGYLSRVIGEIVRLQKKYGCVIALERLSADFKQGRQQFERNIYEQFERDLVGRFGLLMDKDDPDRTRTALQLTAPGVTEDERTKFNQNGIVFFMSPSWITRTDPLTGFANRISAVYTNIKDAERLLASFDTFRFDPDKGRFVFMFRYSKVAPGREAGDPERVWTVETKGTRIVPSWENADEIVETDKVVDLTSEMRVLLQGSGIVCPDGENMIPLLEGKGEKFWRRFLEILRLTLKNTDWNPENREYHIVSCVPDASGRFFDSRTAREYMPKDADVMAAWNIARKAHIVLRRIREYDPENPPVDERGKVLSLRLSVSDDEWFDEVQHG